MASARLLIGGAAKDRPTQARLRRAISTAYYALFHAIARDAADGLVGRKHRATARYTTVYRSFEHRHMRDACSAVDKPTLGAKARTALGAMAASQTMRDVANAFMRLQDERHWADYSPTGRVTPAQAREFVELAAFAIGRLLSAADEERRNFLAYLMLPVRA